MTTESTKPATWYWVISGVALIWNGMGVMAYLMQVMMSTEDMQALPENQRALMESTPTWATSAFAIAVWGGLLASILLLLRKNAAATVFVVSFAGIVVQMVHAFFIANSIEVYGPGGLVMPIMVLAFGAYLIFFSRTAASRGWIS